jgi:hypothetical protein
MTTSSRKRKKFPIPFRPRLEILEDRTLLSDCTVTLLSDTGDKGDLRYCIMQAADGDDIIFADGLTGPIDLTRPLPPLSHNITITGPGADSMTVERGSTGAFGVFTVPAGAVVGISGLTIANGSANQGGGVLNNGTLTIDDTVFQNNTATASIADSIGGGAIYNAGTLTVSGSTFSGNSTTDSVWTAYGGGIYNASGRTANISGSTFTGNTANGYGGRGSGGGIYSAGMLSVNASTFIGNSTNAVGGGITNDNGSLNVSGSTFSGNTVSGIEAFTLGGGIYNYLGTLMVSGSIFSSNSAGYGGGGIYNTGALSTASTVSGSTFSGNSTGYEGGGIHNTATLTVSGSTFTGNSADSGSSGAAFGGAVYNRGTLNVSNSTLFGNAATSSVFFIAGGGGIYDESGRTVNLTSSTLAGNTTNHDGGGLYVAGTAHTRNTILAGNTAARGPDLYGNLGSQLGMGYNLIQNPDMYGSGFDYTDLPPADPLLDPNGLQDNGGPTQTIALLPGSPALNAGDPTQLGTADQRGVIRTGGVNVGAYQASASAFFITAPDTVEAGVPFDITITAVDPFGQVAVGYTGTVTFSTTDTGKGVVLPADYAFTADDSGYHIFTDTGLGETTLITPGDQTITVRDTTDDTIMGSATVTVTGGDAPGGTHLRNAILELARLNSQKGHYVTWT